VSIDLSEYVAKLNAPILLVQRMPFGGAGPTHLTSGNLARGEPDIAIRVVTAAPLSGAAIVSGERGFLGLGPTRK
jgi:hypothetical protein